MRCILEKRNSICRSQTIKSYTPYVYGYAELFYSANDGYKIKRGSVQMSLDSSKAYFPHKPTYASSKTTMFIRCSTERLIHMIFFFFFAKLLNSKEKISNRWKKHYANKLSKFNLIRPML